MALYMKYGTLEGEVTEPNHAGWLAIDSASFGVGRSTNTEVGSGQEKRHRDQPTISDLQISRTYDKASPLLFNEAVVGKPQKVEIDFLEPADGPDAAPNVYLKYTLRNCLLSSYSVGGGGGGATESMALNFTAINIEYTASRPDSRSGTMNQGGRGQGKSPALFFLPHFLNRDLGSQEAFMPLTIFLPGHGGWEVKDGFFDMPKGTTVKFYSQSSKLLQFSDVELILEGTYTGEVDTLVEEFKNAQNMTLHPPDVGWDAKYSAALAKNPDAANCRVHTVTTPTKLKALADLYKGCNLVWSCCRCLMLNPTARGANSGVNATETVGGWYTYYDRISGAYIGGWRRA